MSVNKTDDVPKDDSQNFNFDISRQKWIHNLIQQAVALQLMEQPDLSSQVYRKVDILIRSRYEEQEKKDVDHYEDLIERKLGEFNSIRNEYQIRWNDDHGDYECLRRDMRGRLPTKFGIILYELDKLLDALHLVIERILVRIRYVMVSGSSVPKVSSEGSEYVEH